jgi:hypothetical protein
MTERKVTYRLTREERETHYYYTDGDTSIFCDTTIPKDIRRLQSKGWQMVSCDKYEDGTLVAAKFKAPSNSLTPRSHRPDKPKRTLSEEHKQKLLSARKIHSN